MRSLYSDVEDLLLRSNDENGVAYTCLSCGYKAKDKRSVFEHIESMHITGSGHNCSICGKFCKSRNALRTHTSRYHPKTKSVVSY